MRLLLVKLSALGDVIHALPTLEALRAAFPWAHLTWLVDEAAAPLLREHPSLDELLVVRRRSWLAAGRACGPVRPLLGEIGQLVHRLRHPGYDIVIDLQGLLKSALWVALARSPRKIGYDHTREGSYLALSERLPPFDPEAHAVQRYLNVAHYLGAAPATPVFRLPAWDKAGGWLAPLWQDHTAPLVVLHPGARWPTKLWPAAHWAALADQLTAAAGPRLVFTGSLADGEQIAAITARMRTPAVNLAGRTTLPELARLFRQARLAVTPDTGPMHLAAALGTPLVALFGPTAPWRTGPFSPAAVVLRRALACSPCYQRRCPNPECLTGLTVDEVAAAVTVTLKTYAPTHRSKEER